jgi:kynureninase
MTLASANASYAVNVVPSSAKTRADLHDSAAGLQGASSSCKMLACEHPLVDQFKNQHNHILCTACHAMLSRAIVGLTVHAWPLCAERGNFPTDLYMLEGLIGQLGRGHQLRLVDSSPEAILDAIDESVAMVMLTHVSYSSGRMLDMAGITARAHAMCATSSA